MGAIPDKLLTDKEVIERLRLDVDGMSRPREWRVSKMALERTWKRVQLRCKDRKIEPPVRMEQGYGQHRYTEATVELMFAVMSSNK